MRSIAVDWTAVANTRIEYVKLDMLWFGWSHLLKLVRKLLRIWYERLQCSNVHVNFKIFFSIFESFCVDWRQNTDRICSPKDMWQSILFRLTMMHGYWIYWMYTQTHTHTIDRVLFGWHVCAANRPCVWCGVAVAAAARATYHTFAHSYKQQQHTIRLHRHSTERSNETTEWKWKSGSLHVNG